jgi:hypothetical protein
MRCLLHVYLWTWRPSWDAGLGEVHRTSMIGAWKFVKQRSAIEVVAMHRGDRRRGDELVDSSVPMLMRALTIIDIAVNPVAPLTWRGLGVASFVLGAPWRRLNVLL